MFDDEKIKLIEAVPEADMILVIWIKLLTLAGKKNMNGYIFLTENIPYTDEMLATLFNRPLNTIRLALETFKKFGMINFNSEGQMKVSNWEKHQNIEGLEKIREQGRLRQEKHRRKLLPLNNPPIKELNKNRLDKSRESRDSNVTNIYTHWNNQKVIVHRNIDKYKSAIKAILKDYSEKEIIIAITNYKIILDGNYRWDYRWELDKFLKRGIEKFKDLDIAKNNYKDYKQTNTPTKCNTEEDILKVIGGNDE